jgi:hypothetical protein
MSEETCFRNVLYNIVHLDNIQSIIQHGILCHNLAKDKVHHSIALDEVQERRENVRVPQGKNLHDYANLYINARNPMMFKRRDKYSDLCVLEIDARVIDLPGVVVSDMNASRDMCKFMSPAEALAVLEFAKIYAKYWTHSNELDEYIHKGTICSEVLVPSVVPFNYVTRAYVADCSVKNRLLSLGFVKPIVIEPDMFFR